MGRCAIAVFLALVLLSRGSIVIPLFASDELDRIDGAAAYWCKRVLAADDYVVACLGEYYEEILAEEPGGIPISATNKDPAPNAMPPGSPIAAAKRGRKP